jgi:hypothetical protein
MEEVDHIKYLVNKITTIDRVAKMYIEMLSKIDAINDGLDEEHKVSTEHVNRIIEEYNSLLGSRKKLLKASLKQLAYNLGVTL